VDARASAITSTVFGVVATLASVASPARAQDVPALDAGTGVWVTTNDGDEQHGTVVTVSRIELVLRLDGLVRSIAIRDVRRIEGRDALGNGVRNGGVAGAAIAGGVGVLLSYAFCDIPDGCLSHDVGRIAVLAGLGAGAGMGAGALIDLAIKGRRLLYASSGTSVVVDVTPTFGAHAFGARAVIAW